MTAGLNDYFSTKEQLHTFPKFAIQETLFFIYLNNKRIVYMSVYKHSRQLKNEFGNKPVVVQ